MMMKQMILVCLFTLLGISLLAQSSIYDIGFGLSREEVSKLMTSQGFTQSGTASSEKITYTNEDEKYLDKIVIFFSDDKIDEWYMEYNIGDDLAWADDFVNKLVDFHDSTVLYDDLIEEHVIDLENDRAIYLYLTDDDTVLVVDYCDSYWF